MQEMWSGKLARVFKSDSLLQENEGMFSQKVRRSYSTGEFAVNLTKSSVAQTPSIRGNNGKKRMNLFTSFKLLIKPIGICKWLMLLLGESRFMFT